MKLKYLGTAAAEGWPAIFCDCDNCRKAMKRGGRHIRTRSQALVDDKLLLDFPADSLMHMLAYGIPMSELHTCLITHSHPDHLYPADLEMRKQGFSHLDSGDPLVLYGSKVALSKAGDMLEEHAKELEGRVSLSEIEPFQIFETEGYKVTALLADHDPRSGPLFYLIQKEGKSLLYCHDTGYFPEETWKYLERVRPHCSFVSIDCTNGLLPYKRGYMGVSAACETVERLKEIGCVEGKTLLCLNHFSHNGGILYDELVPIAKEKGMMVSYDGLEINF